MKKEVMFSIIIGFGVGLIATFGIYTAKKAIKNASQIQSPIASSDESSEGTKPDFQKQSLSVSSPIDQSITKELKTAVSGTTTPLSWVIVLNEKGEKIIQADDKGNFETEISLVGGENEIEIQAISENGEKASKTITIVQSTAEI